MCALYAGNLHPECTEATLYQKFATFGKIRHIHICRSFETHQSLGYGYVNFVEESDAEIALSTVNYDLVKGEPIRLMWAKKRRDSFNLSANLFVKNIHPYIDEKAMHDMFSPYGRILSLKIIRDKNSSFGFVKIKDEISSFGYMQIKDENSSFGYVQFENEESANLAIENLHGKILWGKVIYVTKFKKREVNFKNIYIKNFGLLFKDNDLISMCQKFGAICSAKVMTDENGDSKGFGFVSFKESDSAKEAVKELNGTYFGVRRLFVGRAKSKAERQKEVIANLRQKIESALP